MSFEIDIRIDPGQSEANIGKVEKALDRVETKGEQVGPKISKSLREGSTAAVAAAAPVHRLGDAFANMEPVLQRLARTTQIHNQLTNTLAQSMGGLAAAIQREQTMLESIRGPMRRAQQDLETLNALHRRGAITADEYTKALARTRAAAGVNTPTPPSTTGGGMTMLGGARGLAASVGLSLGAREVMQLSDGYTNLENRLRTVARSQGDLNRLLNRTREIARDTRSDWGTTAAAYARLQKAVEPLGVSSERALEATKTLNMMFQGTGASAAEASSATLQLMQAMRSGRLAGEEFNAISESAPDLLDAIARTMGVTTGEMKKLGSEGKILGSVVFKAIEENSKKLREDFEKSKSTFEQMGVAFKNTATEIVARQEAWDATTAQFGQTMMLVDEIARQRLDPMLDQLAGKQGRLTVAQYDAIEANLKHLDTLRQLGERWQSLDTAIDKSINLMKGLTALGNFFAGHEKVTKVIENRLKAIGIIDTLKTPMERHKEQIADVEKLWKAGALSAAEYEQTIRRLRASAPGGGGLVGSLSSADISGVRQNVLDRKRPDGFSAAGLARLDLSIDPVIAKWQEAERAALAYRNRVAELAREKHLAALELEAERIKQAQEEMAQGFGDIATSIAEMAMSGEASFSRMIQAMTIQMLQLLATRAFGSAFGSGMGGGLPGFASGGSFRVGGSGGTDTTPVAFMATPGERVTVTTPAQQAAAREASAGGGQTNITIQLDERDALRALDTPEGERFVVRVIKRNQAALRGVLSGR